jgi:hypothetical protein
MYVTQAAGFKKAVQFQGTRFQVDIAGHHRTFRLEGRRASWSIEKCWPEQVVSEGGESLHPGLSTLVHAKSCRSVDTWNEMLFKTIQRELGGYELRKKKACWILDNCHNSAPTNAVKLNLVVHVWCTCFTKTDSSNNAIGIWHPLVLYFVPYVLLSLSLHWWNFFC